MGSSFSKLWHRLFGRQERRILMLGLDAAGKTTILYKFHTGFVNATVPTIGFNVETLQYKNINFITFDVGGQDRIRKLWRHYYIGTNAIIFIIDSTDAERLGQNDESDNNVATELEKLLQEISLEKIPILFFANKQDLKNALPIDQIVRLAGIHQINDRSWHIQECSAITGDGLYEGLDWLTQTLSKKK